MTLDVDAIRLRLGAPALALLFPAGSHCLPPASRLEQMFDFTVA
jgi:hypothetical protein